MKKKLVVLAGSVLALAPFVALAQTYNVSSCGLQGSGTLFGVLCVAGKILNAIIPVLIALGVVLFVWGVVTYVVASEQEAKQKGRMRMIYGIIGLAVIVGLWGLVSILGRTFGVGTGQNPNVTFPGVETIQ